MNEPPLEVPPARDEIEVTVLARGVGESVVVHLGDCNWCIVDSFDSGDGNRTPAPLSYLRKLRVDPARQVSAIVLTHLDADHYRGMASCVRACPSARVALPGARYPRDFVAYLQLTEQRGHGAHRQLRELREVRAALRERTLLAGPRWASAGREIVRRDAVDGIPEASLLAMSPSDAVIDELMAQLSYLLDNAPADALPKERYNRTTVSLRLQAGGVVALLGGDLEASSDPEAGWGAVVAEWGARPKADLFKVAHHGSRNADDPRIWSDLLTENPRPQALIAPFSSGSGLPRRTDVERLIERCAAVHVAGGVKLPRTIMKGRLHTVDTGELLLRSGVFGKLFSAGLVRARRPIHGRAPWTVQRFDAARTYVPLT